VVPTSSYVLKRMEGWSLLKLWLFTLFVVSCHMGTPHFALLPFAGLVPVHTLASPYIVARISASAVSHRPENSLMLVEHGWIAPLLTCLESGGVSSQQLAATSLYRVSAVNLDTGRILFEAGALQTIARLLRKGRPILSEILGTLRNVVSSHDEIALKAVLLGVPTLLLDVLLAESNPDVRLEAVSIVSSSLYGHCGLLPKSDFSRLYDLVPEVVGWLPAETRKENERIVTALYSIAQCQPRLKSRVLQLGLKPFEELADHPHLQTSGVVMVIHKLINGVV